ncbi:MAG TPA: HAD-IA family hydrolase [Nitrospiraceae bacterium]|nr:HAD-IA family hydrolase [Nitrospiraceae bacterium]
MSLVFRRNLGYTLLMPQHSAPSTQHSLTWDDIDDVLLDMDGTLLDRHFDNVLFEEALPQRYAERQALPVDQARRSLMAMYQSVEGQLEWTDLAYWSRRVGIDVVALHRELDYLIAFLPGAKEFLARLRQSGKRITILTNAHRAGVEIKAAKTGLDRYVDRIVDAFEVGYLKMHQNYWPQCQRLVGFDPSRSLYVDDDEKCLAAAGKFGVGRVYHRSKSSSQLPPDPSAQFTSIEDFSSLMSGL